MPFITVFIPDKEPPKQYDWEGPNTQWVLLRKSELGFLIADVRHASSQASLLHSLLLDWLKSQDIPVTYDAYKDEAHSAVDDVVQMASHCSGALYRISRGLSAELNMATQGNLRVIPCEKETQVFVKDMFTKETNE